MFEIQEGPESPDDEPEPEYFYRGEDSMAYAKFVLAVVATVLTGLVGAYTDGVITNVEWINVAIMGVTACGVFAAPNVPGSMYTKAVLAVLGAVLAALASFITDGISQSELMQLAVIALGALGIYAVPNSTSEVRSSDLR